MNNFALKNFINLNENQIFDSYSLIEGLLKSPKCDFNIIINSLFHSNIINSLIDMFPLLSFEDYRSHKEFIK
jgi:hypothetical protein